MKKRKVHCDGCANLFFIGGASTPMCVATASFESGPIRKRIEVVGLVRAERRNRSNDCPYRASVSLRAWEMKRWLLWRLNDEVEWGKRAKEHSIREYPIISEAKNRGTYRAERPDPETQEQKVDPGEFHESFDEDVLTDGGVGDSEQPSASDTGGGEGVQDGESRS